MKNKENENPEVPVEFIKYIIDAWHDISVVEGKIEKFPAYGGSVFVVFKNKRCYR